MLSDNESDFNRFACNECKRRRIKCARELPVCGACRTAKRHCLYEQQKRSPLTRKHLTEVEEELSLTRQILTRQYPDIDLLRLLGKLRNGASIDEIPELAEIARPKRRRVERLEVRDNMEEAQTPIMNILLLLGHSDNVESQELRFLFQVPQYLPPTINTNKDGYKPKSSSASSPLSNTCSSKFSWDERRSMLDRKLSVTDGMATTESNSYLGATSSAALINLVGGGYFLHQSKPKHQGSASQGSPSSASSIASIPIPSRQRIEHYVNMYFETYHVSYPIVHRPLFIAQMNEVVEAPPGWRSLLYMVAAIGSFMSATNAEDDDDLTLLDCAKKELSIEDLETGSLTLVQTLALISNYLQKRDRPNSGYNYLGLAARMAMGLGLHKDIADNGDLLLNKEMRRRVWWCLYIFDCGLTITYGRPLGIPCAGIDAKLPMNVQDSNLTAMTTSTPREEDGPTIYTSVRLQALFHIFSNSIYERIISDPFPLAEALLHWDTEYIGRYKLMIPSYFQEGQSVPSKFRLAHAVIHWRCRNLRTIMYRTFMLKRLFSEKHEHVNDYEARAGDICLQECSATIESMNVFWNEKKQYNRMDAWYSLYFLIPALLMPLVCLRNDPVSPEAGRWRNEVFLSQKIIDKILMICPPAARISEFISSLGVGCLTQQEHKPTEFSPVNAENMALSSIAVDESPMSQLMQLHTMLWPSSFDIEQQF
uniref:Zn(2)-C6 fungal-type domain-containing protein n=1 Tax=Candidozyma auris TaxID=498019 RepID=A0A0L0P437_CANAR